MQSRIYDILESTRMSHETHRLGVSGNMDTPMRERRIKWGRGEGETLSIHVVWTRCALGRVVESEDFLGFRLRLLTLTPAVLKNRLLTPTPAVLKNRLRLQQF